MNKLIYTDEEFRQDEDGYNVKYVYVPEFDEWMTEDEFIFQKACYDPAMEEAHDYYVEHGCENEYTSDDWDYDDDDDDNDDDDDYPSTLEEAMERYEQTGINNSEFDLNDWNEINRRLGFEFYNPNKKG